MSPSGPGVAGKIPSRFYCHCGKSFIRKEHLRRHESSHGEPAFVCSVCQRSFTRNDLLRRHVALHGDKGAPAPRRAKACNACHESKVKCDGGERCSLCVKRGIECSYDRDRQNNNNTDSMQGVESNGYAAVPSSEEAEEAERGLTLIIKLLASGIKVPTRAGLPEELLPVDEWWQRCSDRYRLGLHNHWPVLHYPTIQDFPRTSMWLEATIAMVATFATYGPGTRQRERALDIHDRLMNICMSEIMNCSMHDDLESQPWPWEIWCVAIINVVFALETGKASFMRRGDRVFDLVLSDCRVRGAFFPDKIKRHQQIHIPGHFPPWVFKNTEHFYRIAAVMWKLDTVLSFAGNTAPRMRREELHVFVPQPFTLWNAYGLGPHFERAPHSPRAAEQYSISQLLRVTSFDFPVFFEDLQLILCEAAQCTWQLAQTRRMDANLSTAVESLQPLAIKKKVVMCCKEIRRLTCAMRDPLSDPMTRKQLLWVYTGKEEPTDPDWEEVVSARVLSMTMGSLMLQCLANMNVHCDVELLKSYLTEPPCDPQKGLENAAHVAAWAHSPDGRLGFLHAMATFIHWDKRSPREYSVHTDITTALAITSASVICQAWLNYILRDDVANANQWGHGNTNLIMDWIRGAFELPSEVFEWANTGTPIAAVDSWPLKSDLYGQLLLRNMSIMQVLRIDWPMCEPVAAALEAQLVQMGLK